MAVLLIEGRQGFRDAIQVALAGMGLTCTALPAREDAIELFKLDPAGYPVILNGEREGFTDAVGFGDQLNRLAHPNHTLTYHYAIWQTADDVANAARERHP